MQQIHSAIRLSLDSYCFRDSLLSFEEFGCVCRALFRNDDGIVYGLEDEELRVVFDVFDVNKVKF